MSEFPKAPFVYSGGKRKAAPAVWAALGDVEHYVEPFAGSLAVLLNRPHECNRPYHSETVNDADGLLCLAPETRVLTDSLAWKPIGAVAVGETLLGFDENNAGVRGFGAPARFRHWRTTQVVATARTIKPCWRLTFDDGTVVVASADHQWLSGSHRASAKNGRAWRWIKTSSLVCNREWQKSWVLKLCDVIDSEETYDAGWLAGFLDGEGNVKRNPGWVVTASQKLGPEADRLYDALCFRGFDVTRSTVHRHAVNPKHQDIENFVVNGGMRSTLRLLMQLRPERLIRNTVDSIANCSLYARQHQAVGLVKKEFLGDMEVVALETDAHTYVAEGLASHNCNAWRSMQRHPEATAEACSWPTSEADMHAQHLALLRWRSENQLEHLMGDPAFCDPVLGGWWLAGMSRWIGSGYCSGEGPWIVDRATGRMVRREGKVEGVKRQLPHVSDNGQGVDHAGLREPGVSRQLPHVSDNGRGVDHAGLREPGVWRQLPHVSDNGKGVDTMALRELGIGDPHPLVMPKLLAWFRVLSARLRHVRILNGDWRRACTSGVLVTLSVRQGGTAGVFLDPPYSDEVRQAGLYAVDSGTVAQDVTAWCVEHGADPRYRVVLAGFEGEHNALETLGWRKVEWYAKGHLQGGYANQGADGTKQHNERLWMSPHCLKPAAGESQGSLF